MAWHHHLPCLAGSVFALFGQDCTFKCQAAFHGCPAGLFKEADANASGGLDRKEFRNVMRSIELGLSTA
jgi:hypothetical protein